MATKSRYSHDSALTAAGLCPWNILESLLWKSGMGSLPLFTSQLGFVPASKNRGRSLCILITQGLEPLEAVSRQPGGRRCFSEAKAGSWNPESIMYCLCSFHMVSLRFFVFENKVIPYSVAAKSQ